MCVWYQYVNNVLVLSFSFYLILLTFFYIRSWLTNDGSVFNSFYAQVTKEEWSLFNKHSHLHSQFNVFICVYVCVFVHSESFNWKRYSPLIFLYCLLLSFRFKFQQVSDCVWITTGGPGGHKGWMKCERCNTICSNERRSLSVVWIKYVSNIW